MGETGDTGGVSGRSSVAFTLCAVGVLAGCSAWESGEGGTTTYTFSNQCGEDLTVSVASGDVEITVPTNETRSLDSVDQVPDEVFVVTTLDGSASTRIVPGVATFTLEGEFCPSDNST